MNKKTLYLILYFNKCWRFKTTDIDMVKKRHHSRYLEVDAIDLQDVIYVEGLLFASLRCHD